MHYLVILVLSLVIWGCPGPDCSCPERESELFVLSATLAPDGGAQTLSWVYDHSQSSQEYSPLDCSCLGEGYSRKLHRFSPSGQILWSSEDSYEDYYGNVYYSSLFQGSDLVMAGFVQTQNEREGGLLPIIYAENEAREMIRYAVVDNVLFGEDYDFPQQSVRVQLLTDETFLFYGSDPSGGMKTIKVSAYGEELWSLHTDELNLNNYFPLNDGHVLIMNRGVGATKLSASGNEIWSRNIGDGSTAIPYSATMGFEGSIIFAGSVQVGTWETDIMVWHTTATGEVVDSFTVTREGCDDSVRVMYSPFNDQIILLSRPRPDCAETAEVLVRIVSHEGEVIATHSLEPQGSTFLAGMDIDADGKFIVAATTNAGREDETFYGRIVKYDSDLSIDWSKTFGP